MITPTQITRVAVQHYDTSKKHNANGNLTNRLILSTHKSVSRGSGADREIYDEVNELEDEGRRP